MPSYGINFQPGSDASGGGAGRTGRTGGSPVQQALQLLNLRLPSVVGARSLAPQQLLNAPGGMSGGIDIVDLLRRLAQQSGARIPELTNLMPEGMMARVPDARPYGPMAPLPGPSNEPQDAGVKQFQPRVAPPTPRVIPSENEGADTGMTTLAPPPAVVPQSPLDRFIPQRPNIPYIDSASYWPNL